MKIIRSFLFVVTAIIMVLSLTACGDDPAKVLRDAVNEINSDESMHAELEGLYTVRAEARGDSTIVVVFKAELEELASVEVSEIVSEGGASEFQLAVDEMRKAGISNPKVILEFLDMSGTLIYSREFS